VQVIEAVAHRTATAEDLKPIPAKQYLEELEYLRRRRRKLQNEIRKDEERVKFLADNCDMFARAESQWLYRDDL